MNNIVDCSFWQEYIDYSKLKKLAQGIILRAGQGTRKDIRFDEFRAGAKQVNLPFGNYFYYDNRVAPKRQAERWAEILNGDDGILGCWLDLEQSLDGDYKSYKSWWDCVAYFKQIKPSAVLGIYTRASYFNDPFFNIPVNHAFRNLPLWIAQYKTRKPDLPKGWSDWFIWQYTDGGDGIAHGVGSKEIDMNYYKGDITEMPQNSKLVASFGNKKIEYKEV